MIKRGLFPPVYASGYAGAKVGENALFSKSAHSSLKQFGVSEHQIDMLSKGKKIIFEDPITQYPTATIFHLEGKTLKAGVWDVVADKPGTLQSFVTRASDLAKKMNCNKIELFGADIQNQRLANVMKKRYGFSPGESIIIDEFGFKNLEVPTLRKTIDLTADAELTNFISKLSGGK